MFGENRHYRVLKPMVAWTFVLSMEGNEWIGRSRCLWPIYQEVTLQPGDQIHDLVGGKFGVTSDGVIYEELKALHKPVIGSIILKGNAVDRRRIGEIAEGYVEAIDASEAFKPTSYRNKEKPVLDFEEGLRKTQNSTDDPSSVARLLLPEYAPEFGLVPTNTPIDQHIPGMK